MDIDKIQVVRRVKTELGIELPYRIEHGKWNFKVDPAVREVTKVDTGTVFIPWSTIEELSEQGTYDSQFGQVLLLNSREGAALEQSGFAVRETRGGYHGTEATKALEKHMTKTYESAVDPLGEDSVNDLIENHSWSAEALRAWFRNLTR